MTPAVAVVVVAAAAPVIGLSGGRGGGGGDVASAGTKGGMKMGLAGWVRVGVMASTARAEHGGGEGHCLAWVWGKVWGSVY